MIHTSRQLKDFIRNLSKTTGMDAQILIRKYMMERFLERISVSKYRERFILKGGMLVSAFVGAESRATMDIDTTIKGISLSVEEMKRVISEISDIHLNDNVLFRIKKVSEIMDEAEYTGVRFSMDAVLDGAEIPLKIDISTGDVITPKEMEYPYQLMFEDRKIPLMIYPVETVLAEKIETLIARSVANSRMRDFYDLHILSKHQRIDFDILRMALQRTAIQRNSLKLLENAEEVLKTVEMDETIQNLWEVYRKKFTYAEEYSWEEVMLSVRKLCLGAGLNVG